MGNSKRNPWELLDRWMKDRCRRAVLASRRLAAERDERIRVSAKVIDRRFVSVQPGSGDCVEPQVELPVDTGADDVDAQAEFRLF